MTDTNQEPPIPKILLVDDEKNILSALTRLLLEEAVEVLTASSGTEGLEVLQRTAPVSLIVSDQRMPGMTGAEFLERSKTIDPDALRIMLTGYADIQATIAAINRGGAFRYVTKPWNDQDLLQVVRDALRQHRLLQENRQLSELVQAQNEELKAWNQRLKTRVLQQTAAITEKNNALQAGNAKLRENFRATIEAFSRLLGMSAVEERDHSRWVADLARAMAVEMQLDDDTVETIHAAGLLHDIGKIGAPDRLLSHSGARFTNSEEDGGQRHPILGQTAVDAIEMLRPAGLLIRHHHEAFDGSGYPDGLKGEAIPIGARIIAMANFIDHALQRRCSDPFADALDAVHSALESLFDPQLFSILEKVLRITYRNRFTSAGMVRRFLSPAELRPGMILQRDLYSPSGLLLLGRGHCLADDNIEAILRYHAIDPFVETIGVMVQS